MKIGELLKNHDLLARIEELVRTGASIGSVEAIIGLREGRLRAWLTRGKENPRTQYRIFYNKYRSWAGEARAIAESQQLAKTPTQWLERNTSARVVESAEPQTLSVQIQDNSGLKIGVQKAINALRVLQESGISIDEALQKNALTFNDDNSD